MASSIVHTRLCAHCERAFRVVGKAAGGAKFCCVDCKFWSRVDKSGGDDACWPWTGHRTPTGYGTFNVQVGGRTGNAHRGAYILVRGQPPTGLVICHRCDNPLCCNPAHLFPATQRENMLDMAAKGRGKRSDEFKERIRQVRLGTVRSEATRAKISASKKGWAQRRQECRQGSSFH